MYCSRSCRQRAYEARTASEPESIGPKSAEPVTQPECTEPVTSSAEPVNPAVEPVTGEEAVEPVTPEPTRTEAVETAYIEVSWSNPTGELEEIFGRPVGAQRPLEALANLLGPGEEVLCGATGFVRGHYGVVAATRHRLLFVRGGRAVIDARFAEIDSFHALVGIWAADLSVESGPRSEVIKQIHPRGRLGELAEILHRHRSGAA